MTKNEVETMSLRTKYMLLGRMQEDCITSINCGRLVHLWGIDVSSHIKYMKWIWESFREAERPIWLSLEQIYEYEAALKILQ